MLLGTTIPDFARLLVELLHSNNCLCKLQGIVPATRGPLVVLPSYLSYEKANDGGPKCEHLSLILLAVAQYVNATRNNAKGQWDKKIETSPLSDGMAGIQVPCVCTTTDLRFACFPH
jgi:hypothetical protein